MFKSVICVGEDFTVDLTGPKYQYWMFPGFMNEVDLFYRWDGNKMMCRTTNAWVDACASYNEISIAGTPCDANTAEVPTEYIARLQQSNCG